MTSSILLLLCFLAFTLIFKLSISVVAIKLHHLTLKANWFSTSRSANRSRGGLLYMLQSCLKPSVAPQGAVWTLNCLKWCHSSLKMTNLGVLEAVVRKRPQSDTVRKVCVCGGGASVFSWDLLILGKTLVTRCCIIRDMLVIWSDAEVLPVSKAALLYLSNTRTSIVVLLCNIQC